MLLRFSSYTPVLILKSQSLKFSHTNNYSQINRFFVVCIEKLVFWTHKVDRLSFFAILGCVIFGKVAVNNTAITRQGFLQGFNLVILMGYIEYMPSKFGF